MKKVIAVAAGLILTGALVTTASAAVSFSGDARVRGYYEKDYDFGTQPRSDEKDVKTNSRYRVKVDADAKGGSYVRSRIKIGDGTHGVGGKTDVTTDYMYLGVPIGPVTIEGGRMPAHLTLFFLNDGRKDMVVGKWSNDMTALQFWYAKEQENGDLINDNDVTGYYGYLNQKFAGDWGLTVVGAYEDDETIDDMSGFTGTINVGGPAGPIGLVAEFAYVSSDLTGLPDDGYGGYIEGSMDFGATSVSLNGGWAQDGFVSDGDFGFIMLGGGASVTPGPTSHFGEFDGTTSNTTWLGGKVGFKASEALSLTGILAYAKFDDEGDAFEISGRAKYMISDGASFQWDMGYLAWDADNGTAVGEESPFGTAVTLEVKF